MTLQPNFRSLLSIDAASYPRRKESSWRRIV